MVDQVEVWFQILDDVWECRVARTGGYTGQLTVRRVGGEPPILVKEVGLMYGAQFGPDYHDVAEWQTACMATVDGHA
jgi:hypothetical protein